MPTDTSFILYSQDFRYRTLQSSQECSSVTLFSSLPLKTKQVFYFWNFLTLQLAMCRPFFPRSCVYLIQCLVLLRDVGLGSNLSICKRVGVGHRRFVEAPSHLFLSQRGQLPRQPCQGPAGPGSLPRCCRPRRQPARSPAWPRQSGGSAARAPPPPARSFPGTPQRAGHGWLAPQSPRALP